MLSFQQRLFLIAKYAIPYLLCAAFLFVNAYHIRIDALIAVKLPLLLAAIYYWSLFRPALLPSWLVFLLGVGFDFLTGLPLGLHALIFLLLQWLVRDQRLILTGQSFFAIWIGFSLVLSLVYISEWAVMAAAQGQALPVIFFIYDFFAGVFIFPLVFFILNNVHRLLPTHELSVR